MAVRASTTCRSAILAGIVSMGLAVSWVAAQRGADARQPDAARSAVIVVPEPIRIEHEHLHENLRQAIEAGGATGEAAVGVQEALAGHFEEENELVMPLLGLLKPLAQGEVTEDMRPAIAMSKQVKQKLPQFMEEHRAIHEAVNRLEQAAEAEGETGVAKFARRLRLHAQHEEAVLYPAAILVGQRLREELSTTSDSPSR